MSDDDHDREPMLVPEYVIAAIAIALMIGMLIFGLTLT